MFDDTILLPLKHPCIDVIIVKGMTISVCTPCNLSGIDMYLLLLLQEGLTPLHLAALYGSKEIVRILVREFQMNPDITDYVSSTFHQASSSV